MIFDKIILQSLFVNLEQIMKCHRWLWDAQKGIENGLQKKSVLIRNRRPPGVRN